MSEISGRVPAPAYVKMIGVFIICLLSLALIIIVWHEAGFASSPGNIDVNVRVVSVDGHPIDNATITLQNGRYENIGYATTGSSGEYCFTGIDPESAVIRALITANRGSIHYDLRSVWYEVKKNTTIEVALPDSGEIKGSITLGGIPAGSSVIVVDGSEEYDSRTIIGPDDRIAACYFNFKVQYGTHTIYAVHNSWEIDNGVINYSASRSNGKWYRSDTVSIDVTPNGTVPEKIVLELKPAPGNITGISESAYNRLLRIYEEPEYGGQVHFSGRVTGADDMPIKDAIVAVEDEMLRKINSTLTDVNGNFTFNNVTVDTKSVRFKITGIGKDTELYAKSGWYIARDTEGIEIKVYTYPEPRTGYIWGFITDAEDFNSAISTGNDCILNGTVYLSNSTMHTSLEVTEDSPGRQFFFEVSPGIYNIYAVHIDGTDRYISDVKCINVTAVWSPISVDRTLLVVKPERLDLTSPVFLFTVLLGMLGISGVYYLTRRLL